MVYRAIGTVADRAGLTISFIEFQENAGAWNYEIKVSADYPYTDEWTKRLETAANLLAVDYRVLDVDFGFYIGRQVNRFIDENSLHYQVSLISVAGFTALFQPGKMISQLGSGASIAAETKLPVVTDMPALDIALGGNGKFMHAIAEKINLDIRDTIDGLPNTTKAVCVALLGIFRWREEYIFLSSITGAGRNSIGGAVWLGQEA